MAGLNLVANPMYTNLNELQACNSWLKDPQIEAYLRATDAVSATDDGYSQGNRERNR